MRGVNSRKRYVLQKIHIPSHPEMQDMTEKSYRYLRVLILLNFLSFFCIVPTIAETSNDYWAPWVTKTTTNSATINWRGESDGSGLIDYATSSYFNQHHRFEKKIASQTTAQYQHVPLTGLEPNTSYTYRVRPSGNENAFGNRTFRTMPISGPFTFIVISDSQEGHNYTEMKRFKIRSRCHRKRDRMCFLSSTVEIMLGMIVRIYGGNSSRLATKCSQNLPSFPRSETMNIIIHLVTTPTAADQYHWAFDMPLNYSFDCAGIRFIILGHS